MMRKRLASRRRVIEACSAIALAVANDDGVSAASLVHRMLGDPWFRASAIEEAKQSAARDLSAARRRDIDDAAEILRSYAGQLL